ncbi:hypothetical protein KDH_39520 [Dictyobacter sp. S3.2.2.5]|uniref:Uncharacterized protein n=1 Tax=Dictyobacter halimunensis TaxID=3026934 RepID=A0ABQ6FX44_9CHLR|nr:hypothetical protein KDH_39520 [Dictyobacter sp. S3.2.2.5]
MFWHSIFFIMYTYREIKPHPSARQCERSDGSEAGINQPDGLVLAHNPFSTLCLDHILLIIEGEARNWL